MLKEIKFHSNISEAAITCKNNEHFVHNAYIIVIIVFPIFIYSFSFIMIMDDISYKS